MDTSKHFGNSKHFNAKNVGNKPLRLQIASVKLEEVGQDRDEKLVTRFFGDEKKGLVLNSSNHDIISSDLGTESDLWIGRWLEVFVGQTTFAGKKVPGVKVRVVADGNGDATVSGKSVDPLGDPVPGDDIPF